MPSPAIIVERLSKRFQVKPRQQGYRTLREALAEAVVAPFRRACESRRDNEDLWALKDINFEVQTGEVLGVIGRNGAGKSTLLKILSRITRPTSGAARVRGRVASLLEVGTGFHPELTGRENVYLNGAILGMSRAEITRKFDEIVSFAEVERFIDMPVKRYSSGMYLRLAFAVAAHLEPEILIIDEVLAVGDAAFQAKCIKQLSESARSGRTVLFVSHNMAAVHSLCTRVMQLADGSVVHSDTPSSAIQRYLVSSQADSQAERQWSSLETAPGDELFRLCRLAITDRDGTPKSSFLSSQPIHVEISFHLCEIHPAFCVGFDLLSSDGTIVFRSYHNDPAEPIALRKGFNTIRCSLPSNLLNSGAYAVALRVGLHYIKWTIPGDIDLSLRVICNHAPSPLWSSSADDRPGTVAPVLHWERD